MNEAVANAKPAEMLQCMKDYIRADKDPEVTKRCLIRHIDHWDTIRDVVRVYRGQNYADFQRTSLISVSTSRKAAEGFAMNRERGRVFTLYLHPGVRYLNFSDYYDAIGIVTYQYEAEIVIPGNSTFVPRAGQPLEVDVYPAPAVIVPVNIEIPEPAPKSAFVKLYDVRGPNTQLGLSRKQGGRWRRARKSRRPARKSRKSK